MTAAASRDVAIAAPAPLTPSVRWALASLSLTMLLAALGTSIANVALPTLAQAFAAAFQDVQWVVLAYLLAITTLIVGAGRLGDIVGCCSPASCCSPSRRSCAAPRRHCRC
jgi:MFS family permease